MNILELVKELLIKFPKTGEICNDVHVDFTDEIPTNYGISSTGDLLVSEDILGNQKRQHNFILYAVYQSQSDYDRMCNTGVLLDLQYYLEKCAENQAIDAGMCKGTLTKLTCSNGMLYEIPDSINDGVVYQMQITAEYEIKE